ncbi:hypothetical protein PZN02_004639 [Sinorhizobium garamanticum]|uniref:Uncharacterized protein n=1 Tax=Sinorhizobium garamanticum TaxID=680247 RepID=A0ABY8DJF7_9HYPH|nr:hypothetical protein [Sinorhizobium garamanticum]WEX91034.1 hypothetical protein PZN02_004639 [Sinorhizobium garamanticum]
MGSAILTKPPIAERAEGFTRAGSERIPGKYPFQLDWIFLEEKHRNKGQLTKLLAELLEFPKGKGVMAICSPHKFHSRADGDLGSATRGIAKPTL